MGAPVIIISKSPSVLVKPSPSEQAGESILILSSYDRSNVGIPATALLVFDQPIEDPVETIKRGLSRALVHYYPISGRLAAGETGDEGVVVKCDGEGGVCFMAASASCALNFNGDDELSLELQEELAMYYPAGPGRGPGMLHGDPLLMMQVTRFKCGGFVVGLTWEHAIADGTGMGQFMRAVGELSRGLPSPSVVPVRSDDSLVAMPLRICPVLHTLRPSTLVLLDVRVPSSLVHRIKRDFVSASKGTTPCSVFEAVTAVVWQCRTRAVMEDPDAPAMLLFGADTRKYAGAKHGYYGNCLTAPQVITTCSRVANGDVMDVVKMIKRAKDQILAQYSVTQTEEDLEDGGEAEDRGDKGLVGYNFLCVTSWRNLGVEKADFGGGPAARLVAYTKNRMSLPLCVSCMPWKDDEFFGVMALCVKEEHAGAFLRQVENFA